MILNLFQILQRSLKSESHSYLFHNKNISVTPLDYKEMECMNESFITIIGKHTLDIGIGYDAKLIKKSLDLIGLPCQYFESNNDKITPINIFTIPAPDALVELTQLNNNRLIYSCNILSCPWELPHWPESLEFLLDYFDYIWVHSDYVYNSIPEKYLDKVIKINLPVEVYIPKNTSLKDKKFIVLTSFDLASTVTRKNPYASIDAFIDAFENDKNVELILKVNNGDIHKDRLIILNSYIENFCNVRIINKHLSIQELHELYNSIDCFISLHRSEGFGRNIAEMMLLKKPVIVTAFSGNMDFTFEENSYLVSFENVNLKPDDYIFSNNQYWAEPNIKCASRILLDIYTKGPDKNKVEKAYILMNEKYNLENCGIIMYKILRNYYES